MAKLLSDFQPKSCWVCLTFGGDHLPYPLGRHPYPAHWALVGYDGQWCWCCLPSLTVPWLILGEGPNRWSIEIWYLYVSFWVSYFLLIWKGSGFSVFFCAILLNILSREQHLCRPATAGSGWSSWLRCLGTQLLWNLLKFRLEAPRMNSETKNLNRTNRTIGQ